MPSRSPSNQAASRCSLASGSAWSRIEGGQVEPFSRYGQEPYEPQGSGVSGREQIRNMFANAAVPPGSGMHYLTTDHIVDIDGDEARLQAQFVVVVSAANARPDTGWPPGADMMQGTLSVF